MTSRYLNTLVTPAVREAQERLGSRATYARHDDAEGGPDLLTEAEIGFIARRDSFYMATVGETGWPYVQHRGGPRGFVKVIDANTLALADFRGNRQYISLGNLAADDRVSLFFMDYPQRTRLKLLGRMTVVDAADAGDLVAAVADSGYKARVERLFLIRVEAFDWNCPQHITPRYTLDEIEPALASLRARIAELEADLAAARKM